MSPLPRQQSSSSSADSVADEMSLHPAEETSDSSSDAASVETAAATDPEETGAAELDNGREAPRSSSATGGASAEPSGGKAADNGGRPSPSGGERKKGGGMDGAVEFGTRSSGGRTAEDRRDRDEEEKKDGAADDEEDAHDFRSPSPSPSSRAGTPGVNPGSPSTLASTSTPAAGTPTFSGRSGTEHPIPDNKSDGDTRESRENVTRPISRDDDDEVGGENTSRPITSEGPFHEEDDESREDVTGPIITEGVFHDAPPANDRNNNGGITTGGTKREPPREGTRTSSESDPSSTMTSSSSRQGEGTDPANNTDDADAAEDGKSEAARHATHDAGADRQEREEEEGRDHHNPAGAANADTASASSAAAAGAIADRPDPPARSSSILGEEKEDEEEQPAASAVGLPIGCYSSGYLDEEGSQRQPSAVGESDSLSEEAKAEEDDAGGDSPLTGKVRTATFSEPVSSVAGDDQSETQAEGTGAMSSTEVLMMTMSPPETPAVPKTLVLSSPSPEPSSEDGGGPVEPEGSVAAVDPKPHAHDERSNDPIGSVVPGSVLDEAQTVETASTLDAPQPAAAPVPTAVVPAPLPSAMTNEDRQRSISFSAAHEVMPPPPAPAADPVAPMAAAAPSPTMQRSFVGGAATMVPHPQQPQPQLQPQPVVQIPAHLQHQHQQLMQPQMQPQMQQPQMAIQHHQQQHAQQNDPSPQRQQRALSRGLSLQQSFMTAASAAAPPGRRKIHFRLMEEEHQPHPHHQSHLETTRATGSTRKLFQKIRRRIRSNSIGDAATGVRALRGYGSSENLRTLQHRTSSADDSHNSQHNSQHNNGGLIYRGTLVVSWYDGTGSAELQEHVLNSASRKLGLTDSSRMTLEDVRIIDDAVEPHEEIVLCPYIPDGSQFVLKFRIKDNTAAAAMAHRPPSPPPPPLDSSISSTNRYARQESVYSRAPESPSAAPSPFPSVANLEQLQMLLEKAQQDAARGASAKKEADVASSAILPSLDDDAVAEPSLPPLPLRTGKEQIQEGRDASDDKGDAAKVGDSATEPATKEEPPQQQPTPSSEVKKDSKELTPDELVLKRLNQLNELLTEGNIKHRRRRKEEKKQVVFVLANYFVLFLSLIAISAEVHTRAPIWMEWLNSHLDSVQSCSEDKDSLYQCVSEGNFSGLVAAFVFWITRSAATKNVLLFGFDSPQKLWTVVYEAGVSAVCWGCSYMFIRRGLNPDTRPNFLHKYWKDAVYGSLAGFNAAFMKAVLKNLLPQDQVLDVLESRQLRIVDWVSHIFMTRDT